eukprot:XP_014042348.1 PREDICTED: uncharacterized protein LOC106595502 [Salmo salar]
MELSEGSQSFTQMLRGLDDLEPNLSERDSQNKTACSAESSQSPSHYCRPDRPKRRITSASCTLNEDIDAILPFCSNGFTLTPPRNQATYFRPKQGTTSAQVHCEESPRPNKLLLQETALHGHDSSPAYNGTEDHTHREPLEDFGAPDIHNKTRKTDDLNVLNDISQVDDWLFCNAANLLDSSNSYVETPKPEIDQAEFIKAFSKALKSRNVLLHQRMVDLLERQYSQDLSFWHRTMPRLLKRKYRR